VRDRQSIDLKPCKVNLNTWQGARTWTTTRRFLKVLGLGSNLTVLRTRLSGIPCKAPNITHVPPFPIASRVGDYSRLVIVSSRTGSLRYKTYRSHSRQVLSTFKSLTHESHWTGDQIPCSYHMSNPFIKIL
jgi:hypothetical protein